MLGIWNSTDKGVDGWGTVTTENDESSVTAAEGFENEFTQMAEGFENGFAQMTKICEFYNCLDIFEFMAKVNSVTCHLGKGEMVGESDIQRISRWI